MARLINRAKKSYEFVSGDLWKVRMNKVNRKQGFLLRHLRVVSLAAKGFRDDECLTYATSLSFYTLFSIVPVLALVFAIAKGFGYEKDLEQQILNNYSEYSDVLINAFTYANSMLASTKGGVIAGVGVILLLWSVMRLLISIEDSFNKIWYVKTGRTFVRKMTDYLTIMMIGPIFLILSITLSVSLQTKVGSVPILGGVSAIFFKLLALALITAVFTFLYVALPNIKVKYKNAIAAAVFAAIAFELVSWGYIRFQVGANRLNAIYGGFAALPLFLIWVQYNWYIVLFGAELSFAYQNVDHYELSDDIKNLSPRYRKVIALLVANLVSKRFYNREPSLNMNEIADKLDLPVKLARTTIEDFVETGVFVEVKKLDMDIVYQPGVTESQFTVKYVIDALDRRGVNTLPISDTEELIHINKLMAEMDKLMDTDLGHLHVKDIVKS